MATRGLLDSVPPDFIQSIAFRGLMITNYLDARCDDMPRMVRSLERIRRVQQLFLGIPFEKQNRSTEALKPEFET